LGASFVVSGPPTQYPPIRRVLQTLRVRRLSITLNRCGHLMPGSEEEAAGLLDSCLEAEREAAEARARAAAPASG
jgi:hypothetical protein